MADHFEIAALRARETGVAQYVGFSVELVWGLLSGPPATDRTHWRIDPDGSVWLHEAPPRHSLIDGFSYDLVDWIEPGQVSSP